MSPPNRIDALEPETPEQLRHLLRERIATLEAELKEAKRLRADDLALLARVHARLGKKLEVGIEVGPEECVDRLLFFIDGLVAESQRLREYALTLATQRDGLLTAAKAVLVEAAHHGGQPHDSIDELRAAVDAVLAAGT